MLATFETAARPTVRKTARKVASDAAPRIDIYQTVTDKIIAQLETGVLPWVQPWTSGKASPSMPHNASTGRTYSGVNVLLLWAAMMEGGHSSAGWMTFNQAKDAGGMVRKGEKGTPIFYADRFVPSKEKERAERDGDDAQSVYFMKKFTVFNVAQIDGLPADMLKAVKPMGEIEQIAAAQRIIEASGADFRIGGAKAFYAPGADFIAVPSAHDFHDIVNWNRTALHELTHWTGHQSRLARRLMNEFGSKDYAREELIAEMGSAFLCASLGIIPTVRHADYIGSWLTVLREDKRAIFKAASMASKAADYLLNKADN